MVALQIVTGTHAGGQVGWPARVWTFVFHSRPCCLIAGRDHAQITMSRLSDNQLYSRCTVWHGQIGNAQSPSIPPLPLHHSMLTILVNLGHQSVQPPTHHWIHIPQIHCGCILGQKAMQVLGSGVPENGRHPEKRTEWNGCPSCCTTDSVKALKTAGLPTNN